MAYIDKNQNHKKALIKFLNKQSELLCFDLVVSYEKNRLFKKSESIDYFLVEKEEALIGCKIIQSLLKNKQLDKNVFIYTENSLSIRFFLEEKSSMPFLSTKKYNYSVVVNTGKLVGHIEVDNSIIHSFDFSSSNDNDFNEMVKLLMMAIGQREVNTVVL